MGRPKKVKRKQLRGPGGGFARSAPEVASAEDAVDEPDTTFSGRVSPMPLPDDGGGSAAAMHEAEDDGGEGAAGSAQDECQATLPLGPSTAAAAAADGSSNNSSSDGLEIAPPLILPPCAPRNTHGDTASEAAAAAGGGGAAAAAAAAAAASAGAGSAGVASAASSGEGGGVPDIGNTAAAATRTSTREGKFSGPFFAPKRAVVRGGRGHGGRGAKLLLPDEVLSYFAEIKGRKGKASRKLRKANLRLHGEVWTREKRSAAIRANCQQEGARTARNSARSTARDTSRELQQGAAAATAEEIDTVAET